MFHFIWVHCPIFWALFKVPFLAYLAVHKVSLDNPLLLIDIFLWEEKQKCWIMMLEKISRKNLQLDLNSLLILHFWRVKETIKGCNLNQSLYSHQKILQREGKTELHFSSVSRNYWQKQNPSCDDTLEGQKEQFS